MTDTAGGARPMLLNLDELVWPGRLQPIFALSGIVATSQPLAAGVGVEILAGAATPSMLRWRRRLL